MKVKATNEYVKRNLQDVELKRIPKEGEEFEVSEERFQVLNGKNRYNAIFVEKVELEGTNEVDDILSSKRTTKKSK